MRRCRHFPFAALSADGVNVVPQSYPKPLGPASADEIAGGTTVQLGIDVMPPHGIGLFYDMAYFTIDEADPPAVPYPTACW